MGWQYPSQGVLNRSFDDTNNVLRVSLETDNSEGSKITSGAADVFARTVVANPQNDIDVQFFRAALRPKLS